MKKWFIGLAIGILIFGIGIGVCFIEFTNFTYIEDVPNNYPIKEVNYNYPINDNVTNLYLNNAEYEVITDDSVNDISINIKYYDKFTKIKEIVNSNNNITINFSNIISFKESFIVFKEILKNKQLFDIGELYETDVIVKVNSKNIEKIRVY